MDASDHTFHRKNYSARTRAARRISSDRQPLLEPLEPRTLLSISVSAVQTTGGLHVVTITTSGNNSFAMNMNGSGRLQVFNGSTLQATRQDVDKIVLRCGGGADFANFNLITDISRPLFLDFNMGSGNDRLSVNLNNDFLPFSIFELEAQGGNGNDSIRLNADRDNNTDGCAIGGNCRFVYKLFGGAGSDSINVGYRGNMNAESMRGEVLLDQFLDTGLDSANVSLVLETNQPLQRPTVDLRVEGGFSDDNITCLVADRTVSGSPFRPLLRFVSVDAGTNLFDRDVVTHTSNVPVFGAEVNILAAAPAFSNRTVTPQTQRGEPTTISGIITEPNATDTFFLDVDWGDGTVETFTFAPGSFVSGVTEITLEHVYHHPGHFNIGLTWRDQIGLFNEDDTLIAEILPWGKGIRK